MTMTQLRVTSKKTAKFNCNKEQDAIKQNASISPHDFYDTLRVLVEEKTFREIDWANVNKNEDRRINHHTCVVCISEILPLATVLIGLN